MKFLIVADSPDGLERVAQGLQKAFPGSESVEVFRKEDFVKTVASGDFDVAITEDGLSWADGLWVLGTIKGRSPDVPVIMVTSAGREDVAVAGMRAGLSDYVFKETLRRLPVAVRESPEKARLRQGEESLRKTRDELEQKVEERTLELLNAIEILKREIVDRQRVEEARQAAERELEAQGALSMRADRLRSLGEMAAGIAHELNQPLTGVRGMAEHLLIALDRKWDLPEEKMREKLTAIVEQADRMSHIIEHIRMFSREAGRPECRAVDVNEVVRSALGLLGAQFRSHGIEVGCELGEGLPSVWANPFSLEEVALNLLLNARDAVEEKTSPSPSHAKDDRRPSLSHWEREGMGVGEVARITDHESREWEKRVWVQTRVEGEGPEGWVVMEVADEGVGIAAELQEKVFDPFFTTKGLDRGTGLGLSVSRSIVEGFGGKVQVRSEPGQGTTVTVSLPVLK